MSGIFEKNLRRAGRSQSVRKATASMRLFSRGLGQASTNRSRPNQPIRAPGFRPELLQQLSQKSGLSIQDSDPEAFSAAQLCSSRPTAIPKA